MHLARDHDIIGTGVDINSPFVAAGQARASELGVSDRVIILRDNATDWVSTDPVDIAACLGATWIGGGVSGRRARLGWGAFALMPRN